MTAKKNFCSLGFSAKFGSIYPVLQCIGKHSALKSILLSSLYLFFGFIFKHFASEGISVAH